MFRVQPAMLTTSTRALSDVTEVSRALDASRGEITDLLSRTGFEPVSRSAEAFLDAWGTSLRDVSERVEWLGSKLRLAAAEYEHAEQRLRSQLGHGADGGPA